MDLATSATSACLGNSIREEMLEELGTPVADKSLILFEQSGHSFEGSEMDKLVEETINFIEQYK